MRDGKRNLLKQFLENIMIGTLIHCPVLPYWQECYHYLGYKKGDFPIVETFADEVLSIPLYYGMTEEEQTRVIKAINTF